jgi:hypothetical protein
MTALVSALDPARAVKARYDGVKSIDARLRQRDPTAAAPQFVGLLNPNSQSGVFLNSAPGVGFEDTSRDKLLDYLSTNLYGGTGGHGLFSKTIGAGLAYSNGATMNLGLGRMTYYAERTPDLPQTLRFVIGEVAGAKPDPSLVEYAIAQSFAGSRAASSYETRAEMMAQNLVDGVTPEVVSRFRKQVLDLRRAGNALVDELYKRKDGVYATIFPGLDPARPAAPGGVYFVIGAERQFASWEQYLKSVAGPDTTVYRLYPRDFWLPADVR